MMKLMKCVNTGGDVQGHVAIDLPTLVM